MYERIPFQIYMDEFHSKYIKGYKWKGIDKTMLKVSLTTISIDSLKFSYGLAGDTSEIGSKWNLHPVILMSQTCSYSFADRQP